MAKLTPFEQEVVERFQESLAIDKELSVDPESTITVSQEKLSIF